MTDKLDRAINYLRMQGYQVIRTPSGCLIERDSRLVPVSDAELLTMAQRERI